MLNIVVGVDGSLASASAARWAAELAGRVEGHVLVTSAWSPDQAEVAPGYYEELEEEAALRFDEELSRPTRAAVDAGDVDLVIVGVQPKSEVTGARLGGVGLDLVDHVHRPLLVVPAEARSPRRDDPSRPDA
jgi:nucleotide-binding universal stress UspA family protein